MSYRAGRFSVACQMSASSKIARAHGGQVSGRSDAQTGTTFTVTLPRRPGEKPAPKA